MLNFYEIGGLKQYLAARRAGNVHMHDTCGGLYFALDRRDPETEKLIDACLAEKGNRAAYAPDRLQFTVEPARQARRGGARKTGREPQAPVPFFCLHPPAPPDGGAAYQPR